MHPNIEIRARVIANVLDDAYRHSLATKHLYLLSLLLGDSMVGLGLSKSICQSNRKAVVHLYATVALALTDPNAIDFEALSAEDPDLDYDVLIGTPDEAERRLELYKGPLSVTD